MQVDRLKIALLTILCLLSFLSVCQQNQKEKLTKDSLKTLDLAREARNLTKLNNDSALHFADLALDNAKKTGSSYLIGIAKDRRGLVLQEMGRWGEAVRFFDEAIQALLEAGWIRIAGQSYLHRGNLYLNEGEVQEMSSNWELSDKSYQIALASYEYARQYFTKVSDTIWMARAHQNLGATHYRLYNHEDALMHYETSAEFYTILGDSLCLADIMMNQALLYEGIEQPDSARYYYLAAKEVFIKTKDFKNWINTNINMVGLYEEEQPSKAIALLEEADSLSRILKNQVQQAFIQEYLYTIHSSNQNYRKALAHLENYHALKDSMLNAEFKTEELNVRYQTTKQKELIQHQKAENLRKELELEKSQSENSRNLIIGIGTFLFVTGVVIVLIWRQRKESIIQSQKEEILRQQMAEKEASAMLAGQEKERVRLAEDLHDKLGATLSAARLQLDVASAHKNGKQGNHLIKAQHLIDKAIEDGRSISHNMISGVLTNLGLAAALRDLKESLEVTGRMEIKLEVEELLAVNSDVELQLFRISQELVNNAFRHSEASLLTIKLWNQGCTLFLTAEDDGKGFEVEKIHDGLGLKNIRRRLSTINGSLHVQSAPGKGSFFSIEVNPSHEQIKNPIGGRP